MAEYRNAKPCGGALLLHDDRLLLVRRSIEPWRGCWDIPGGFCEEREHPMAAAERELYEETGVRGRAVRFVGMWIDDYEGGAVTLSCYYLCEPVGDPRDGGTGSDEVSELGWFALDELPEEISFPGHARQVLDVLRVVAGDGLPHAPLLDRPA